MASTTSWPCIFLDLRSFCRFCENVRTKQSKVVPFKSRNACQGTWSSSWTLGNSGSVLQRGLAFAFDDIHWKFIDSRYYEEFTSVEERFQLLSAEEQSELNEFVSLKMQQAEIR